MEEIRCNKGTPAQVMRHVLDVLAAEPNLYWSEGPTPSDFFDNLQILGRLALEVPDDQGLVKVIVIGGDQSYIGMIEAKQSSDFVLVTAQRKMRDLWPDEAGTHHITEDFSAMAPVWEKVKAELVRRGVLGEDDAAKSPRVPKQQKRLNEWRAIWRKIKPEWRRGREYYEIRQWLHAQDTKLERSEDILAEIIAAGEAGRLDQDTPENSR